MGVMDRMRVRAASPYVAPGQAPDSPGVIGLGFQAGANLGGDVNAAVQTSAVVILLLLAVVVVGHIVAK